MERDPGLKKLVQIAVVCRDIEATASRWAELLGVEKPTISTTDRGHIAGMTYRGKASDAQAKLAFFDLGGCALELIQPLGAGSSWQDGLDKNGESVHHVAFEVKDLSETKRVFEQLGMPMVHTGHWDGTNGTYAYMDCGAKLGVMIELLNYQKK